MQYKSLICELIEVANRIVSNNDGCTPASIMADGRVCKDCNCDDCRIDVARYICGIADRLALAHKADLKTLKKRYKTDLQNARESRDIAIKEAAELRDYINLAEDLVHNFRRNIAMMLGISCDGMAGDVYDAIKAELDRRLMPPGMEWPRFDDGKQITWDDAPEDIAAVCIALDGSCYALHYDMPDDERMCIYEMSERVKRPVTEVLGADGVPIKVGETVYEVYDVGRAEVVKSITYVNNFCKINYESDGWGRPNILIHTSPDTQERINEDASMHPHEYCKKYGIQVGIIDDAQYTLSNFIDPMVFDLLRRQRELDARTMGGDAA